MQENLRKETSREVTELPIAKVKKPHNLDLGLKPFPQLTSGQKLFEQAYYSGYLILGALGSAGTGKTAFSIYLALKDLEDKSTPTRHIKIIRSAVPVREVGFLKGSKEEKEEAYNIYKEMVNKMCSKPNAWEIMEENGFISFTSTSYEQGKTYDDTVVIADEVENFTFKEIDLTTTRLGEGSRLMLVGDVDQTYLRKNEKNELGKYTDIIDKLTVGKFIQYSSEDIVRSGVVRDYICMKNHLLNGAKLPDIFECDVEVIYDDSYTD